MSEEEKEETAPDSLEEAGVLEADVGARFDQQLANIDPRLKVDIDPLAHQDLRPEMMFIREELRQAKWQTLAADKVRRTGTSAVPMGLTSGFLYCLTSGSSRRA